MSPRLPWPRGGARTRLPVVFRKTASTEFQPTDISGLALWLDGSDANSLYTTDAGAVTAVTAPTEISGCALWLDASDTSTITQSGGLVSQWNDKSGNGRHAFSTGANRPTTGTRTVNGRNAIDYTPFSTGVTGNYMWLSPTSGLPAPATHTVFMVVQLDTLTLPSAATDFMTLLAAPTIARQEIRITCNGSSTLSIDFNTSVQRITTSTGIGPAGTPLVVTLRESATPLVRSAGAGLAYSGGGTPTGLEWVVTDGSSKGLYIGSRGYGHSIDGLLCEVIIFSTTLSDADTSRVEAYLAAKWGISGVHAPATAASDPVGYWRDRSGNNRHATQSTAASRPVVGTLNNKKALVFDGTNDTLFVEDYTADSNLPGMTRFIVFDSDANANMIFASTGTSAKTGAAGGGIWWQRFGANWYGYCADGIRYNGGTADESPHVATNFFDGTLASSFGTRLQNYIDGALLPVVGSLGTLGTTTGSSGAKLSIGSNLGLNNFVSGKILEAISYSRALSASERRRAERYLAAKWGITLAPQVSNPDAQDWVNRVYANGGTVSSATAIAVNTFCDSITNASLRDRFYRLNLFCGTGLNAALVPLYRGPSLGGTQYGNTADTNNGPFVSGDYAETNGLDGDGVTKYLNTGLSPDGMGVPATVHLAAFKGAGAWTASREFIGTRDADDLYQMQMRYPASLVPSLSVLMGGVSSVISEVAVSTGASFLIATRPSSSELFLWQNGTKLATGTTNATTPGACANPYMVFTRNASGTAASSPWEHAMLAYSIGLGLSDSQAVAYNTAMQTFQTALGRNV